MNFIKIFFYQILYKNNFFEIAMILTSIFSFDNKDLTIST